MLASKAPVKIKEGSLFQFEEAFRLLNQSDSIILVLSQSIIEGYIASSLVLKKINTLKDLRCSWKKIDSIPKSLKAQTVWVVFSDEGDTYLVKKLGGNRFRLSTYDHSGVEVETYEDALGNLTKDLGLTSSGLVIEPVQKTSKSETSTSYVLRHFLIQKSTAKVIISISLVIALLGLATPLGFQTFTDKILPYSAQGSLLVVVALLLLAAIATSVFQCFRDY